MSDDFAWWRDRDWILLLIRQLQQGLAIIINNGGVPKTAAVIGSGIAYTVKPTDAVIAFDSSIGSQAQPVATLNAGTYIGEAHSFVWYGWGGNQTPPLIQGAAAGVLMMPYAGMQTEGIGGLSRPCR
ncbi:MAG TPA: hypothetical protein VNV25_25515 [Gemmatimonadaceae bacterium]|jgi:hypothetical protein|nr:hypothetical protein [Gemmatimonadaceae bacterium]